MKHNPNRIRPLKIVIKVETQVFPNLHYMEDHVHIFTKESELKLKYIIKKGKVVSY